MNCSARRPCFIDHLFLTFDFRQLPRRNFLQLFPFLVHRCFRCRNFHTLRHKKLICAPNCNAEMNSHLFLQYGPRDYDGVRIPHTKSRRLISFQNTRKFCFIFVGYTTPTILHNFTGQSKSDRCFQLLTRVLDGFLEFRILWCR